MNNFTFRLPLLIPRKRFTQIVFNITSILICEKYLKNIRCSRSLYLQNIKEFFADRLIFPFQNIFWSIKT